MQVIGGALWRQPGFARWWIARSISALGSQVTLLALPLTAVLIFGAGPAETGALLAAETGAMLVVSLFVGVWVDRLPRRPILIGADLASAAIIGSVPAAAALCLLQMQHLYIVALAAGAMTNVNLLASGAFIPDLVGREHVLEANSRLQLSRSIAQVGGPSLGGVMVQLVTAPLALLVDAASFLISAVLTSTIRVPETQTDAQRQSVWREMSDGFRWVRQHSIVLRLVATIGLANFAWFGERAVLLPYATRGLELSPAVLGVALAAVGPASIIGALSVGPISRRWGLGPTMVTSLLIEGTSRILPSIAGGPMLIAAAILMLSQALFGFMAPLWDVNSLSLRQTLTPAPLLGRVNATSAFVAFSMAPVGSLVGGWLGETVGPRMTFVALALVTFLAFGLLVRSRVPSMRTADHVRAAAV